jgi:hypothetical protein
MTNSSLVEIIIIPMLCFQTSDPLEKMAVVSIEQKLFLNKEISFIFIPQHNEIVRREILESACPSGCLAVRPFFLVRPIT